MALDSSIPLQSVAPDPMASLSSMLDVGAKSLSLQKNRATFDADVAKSKADSSTSQSTATVNAANVQPRIQQQAAETSSAVTKANADQFSNRQTQVKAAQQAMREFLINPELNETDPTKFNQEKVNSTLDTIAKYASSNGHDPQQVMPLIDRMKAAKGPGNAIGVLKSTLLGEVTGSAGISAMTPSGIGVTNGNVSSVVNTAPFAGKIGSAIPGTQQTAEIPIASQQTQGTDLNGNPAVNNKDKFGNVQAPTPLPGSNARPLTSYPAGESNATKGVLEGEAMTAKNTALNAPSMHANNKGILEALNEVIATGPAGKGLAKLAGYTGLAFDTAEKVASAYDTIGKLAEKNALAAAASMGTATNAQLEAQVKANGSASYNPTALRNITKLNDALVTGSEKYATGMQKAIDEAGHVFGKRQFDQQWAQNAHVDTLKFLNAVKTGDKQEQAALIKSVGGLDSQGGQRLIQQMKNLQKLTQTGSL